MPRHQWFVALGLALLIALPAIAQPNGTSLRPHAIHGLTGTRATSLDLYRGRLVLLELFAHW